jgi:CRISPR system Cascade subunit CasB
MTEKGSDQCTGFVKYSIAPPSKLAEDGGKPDQCTGFVQYIISRLENNRAMRARLSRADNPATKEQSWQYLVRFIPDFENNTGKLRIYALIAAALARAEPKEDGDSSLGRALALLKNDSAKYVVGEDDEHPALPRLRRLLACSTAVEACDVLRPLLKFITDKSLCRLSYAGLMRDLLDFDFSERTRMRWAQDFFTRTAPKGEDA